MSKPTDSKPEVLLDAAAGVNKLKRGERGRFAKGTPKKGGRKKGTPNRINADAKELMDALVLHGLEAAKDLFDASARKSPSRALQVLARFAEYRLPKLARVETTGPNGGPQIIEKRVYVSAASPSEADAVAAHLHKDKE